MSGEVIEAAVHFQRRRFRVVPTLQAVEDAKPSAYETLILGPDVTLGELMHALRHTDIVLDASGPFQILKRNNTPPKDAA